MTMNKSTMPQQSNKEITRPDAGNARLSRWWHFVLALVVLGSFIMQTVILVTGGPDVNSGSTGADAGLATRFIRLISFFTIQSNLLVLFAAISLAIDPQRDGPVWRVLRLDALLGIVITGIVFATVLAGLQQHTGMAAWTNAGFHYFSPCWTLLGWLLFGPRPRITWRTVGLSFLWPALWTGYTFARGAITDWYPYPFMNVTKLGYAGALSNTALVLLLSLVIATMLKALDERLPTVNR